MSETIKRDRVLDLFFRAMKGESLSVQDLANEYEVSTRSISRDITDLKAFLSEHADVIGYTELVFDGHTRTYHLELENFISNKELLAMVKVLIGARPFNQKELLTLINKLKAHTSRQDRKKLEGLILKEIYNYPQINADCDSVIDRCWQLTEYIYDKRIISIDYIKIDRTYVKHRILPLSIMFTEYYYYLIAYEVDDTDGDVESVRSRDGHKVYSFIGSGLDVPHYFRVDRIIDIISHRGHYHLSRSQEFDESVLRQRSQFMWPGELQVIRFEFTGPSVQAVLDRLPTAKIINYSHGVYTIDATVYGDGIIMYLLSQGSWVKVLSPESLVERMKEEIGKIKDLYD
ncbi:MAG: WYL domain-containing transcriptional regulator [Eubacterium sp.]|nr:WYL domain-containing transcriptional regulator [Eubacterium sp.]